MSSLTCSYKISVIFNNFECCFQRSVTNIMYSLVMMKTNPVINIIVSDCLNVNFLNLIKTAMLIPLNSGILRTHQVLIG